MFRSIDVSWYDIRLSREVFDELAPEIGFRKHDCLLPPHTPWLRLADWIGDYDNNRSRIVEPN